MIRTIQDIERDWLFKARTNIDPRLVEAIGNIANLMAHIKNLEQQLEAAHINKINQDKAVTLRFRYYDPKFPIAGAYQVGDRWYIKATTLSELMGLLYSEYEHNFMIVEVPYDDQTGKEIVLDHDCD